VLTRVRVVGTSYVVRMKHRAARHRKDVGRLGECLAERFLVDRGLTVVARNTFIEGDELDLIVLEGSQRVVVEVKTSANGDDPMEAIDDVKAHRIRRAVQGYELPVDRIDAIAVRLTAAALVSRGSVVTQPSCFFVPTPAVPVSPQVWGFLRDDDDVTHARFDSACTPGTYIALDRLVRLYWMDCFTTESGDFGSSAGALWRSARCHCAMVRALRGNRPTVVGSSTIAGCPVS